MTAFAKTWNHRCSTRSAQKTKAELKRRYRRKERRNGKTFMENAPRVIRNDRDVM